MLIHKTNTIHVVGHSLVRTIFTIHLRSKPSNDTGCRHCPPWQYLFSASHPRSESDLYRIRFTSSTCFFRVSVVIFDYYDTIFCVQVGNQNFANYVDASGISFTRVNNRKDPFPILPGTSLGYVHPSNEIHISENTFWESCPGMKLVHS
jgi:hypothetical protein